MSKNTKDNKIYIFFNYSSYVFDYICSNKLCLYIILIIIMNMIFSNYSIAEINIDVRYSMISAFLPDATIFLIDRDGWEQDNDTTSIGSEFNSDISWNKVYVHIGLKSATDLLPTEFDAVDISAGVQTITAIFGIKKLPFTVGYSHRIFKSNGHVTELDKLRRNNIPLNIGDKLEFGATVDTLTLQYLFKINDFFLYNYIGLGAGKMITEGIRGINKIPGTDDFEFGSVEEKNTSFGTAFIIKMSNLDPVSFPTKNTIHFSYDMELIITDRSKKDIFGYLKQGYTMGVVLLPLENMFIRFFCGSFQWIIHDHIEGFDSVITLLGLEGGVGIGIRW